jgi:preprotein translocase subunit YajC
VRTKVALMEGSLASQEVQLKESVPIEMKLAQDAELEVRITELGNGLRAQVIAVKERVTEVEGRMAAQEGEVGNIRIATNERMAEYLTAVNRSVEAHQAAQTEALRAQGEELLQTVDDRNASIRELVYQVHEALQAQRVEGEEATQVTADRLTALEESIASTDALLSEHVNSTQQEFTYFRQELDTRAYRQDLLDVAAELREGIEHNLAGSASEIIVTAAIDKLAVFETEHSRLLAEVDLKLTAYQSTSRVKWAELEGRLDEQDEVMDARLNEASAAQAAETEQVQLSLAELEERLNSTVEELQTTVRTSEAAVLTRVGDASQLLQMQEKRLRAVEKATDAKSAEAASLVEAARQQLVGQISALSGAVNQLTASQRENLHVLTTQLVALQGQMNDHSDEVRSALETEVTALKSLLHSEISDFTAASTSATRVEEWLTDLQRAHDDHVEQCEAAAQQHEERFQSVEASLETVQDSLSALRTAPPLPAAPAESTVPESAVVQLRADLSAVEVASKQRVTALEQRMVRQEAQSREKSAELAESLKTITSGLAGRVTQVEERLATVEAGAAQLGAVVAKIDEMEGKITAHAASTELRLQQAPESVAAKLQATRTHSSADRNGSHHHHAAQPKRAQSTPHRGHADAADTTTTARFGRSALKGSTTHTSAELAPADGSHIMHVSPVKKLPAGADILGETCELTMLNEAAATDAGGADLIYTSDDFDEQDQGAEAQAGPGDAHGSRASHSAASGAGGGAAGRYRDESSDDEYEFNAEHADRMQEFQSVIEKANSDIAALGSHLKAFQPGEGRYCRRGRFTNYDIPL